MVPFLKKLIRHPWWVMIAILFDEIRIGMTAAMLNYYIGNNTLQVVWVPIFQPNEYP